jgi:alginate O-acetyltransferase complex protein AlgI
LVDIYKGIVKTHSAEDFLTYFFMFPHLVAGPIVRFEGVREDLQARKHEGGGVDKALFSYGVFRFVLGVNKKVLIANSVAPLADLAFYSWTPSLGAIDAWIGALAYTVQIYFDFSGYSDMAIGLAAMMGVRFDENFRAPYKSDSIKEFWRRWHISLSSWLRDYLYFPLGGSRCSKICTYRNLLTVFILCGLWHGAQFTFLAWGLFHGGLLILERTKFGTHLSSWPACVRRCYCMFMVVIGWVLFRAESITQAFAYISCMFDLTNLTTTFVSAGWINLSALLIGLIAAMTTKEYFIYRKDNASHYPIWLFVVNLILFFVSIAVLYTSNRNPFIYFNF